jgi:murein L,D-transpeptidase YafK
MRAPALLLILATCDRAPQPRTDAAPPPPATENTTTAPSSSSPPPVAVPSPDCPAGYVCGGAHPPDTPVDLLLVEKRAHRLSLVAGQDVLATYTVAIGSGGHRQKTHEGDKTTPVGRYKVTAIIKNTKWHTYLALDYPAPEDVARYEELVAKGEAPARVGAGSGIAIHGRRADMADGVHKLVDWTLGCVALDNPEIDAVAARVSKGTPVEIRP